MRVGRRYGLRVQEADASVVHALHKPDIPYMESPGTLDYHGGPFPFGATRNSIMQLFRTWKWAARPVQPKHRTPCGTGIIWHIQASATPPFEVYRCEHADVLLTVIHKHSKPGKTGLPDVQASRKTLEALTQGPSGSGEDPLLVNDPWAKSLATVKQARLDTSASYVDTIAAKVEKSITDKLIANGQLGRSGPHLDTATDDDMGNEDRLQGLEARVQKMEESVQQQHEQQTQYNKEMASQVVSLQQKQESLKQHVEMQTVSIQNHMDQRMAEQFQQIEQLLTQNKKARSDSHE